MARPKATVKGQVVVCPECMMTYEIAIDKQEAWCTGQRTATSIAHKKHMRMR